MVPLADTQSCADSQVANALLLTAESQQAATTQGRLILAMLHNGLPLHDPPGMLPLRAE